MVKFNSEIKKSEDLMAVLNELSAKLKTITSVPGVRSCSALYGFLYSARELVGYAKNHVSEFEEGLSKLISND